MGMQIRTSGIQRSFTIAGVAIVAATVALIAVVTIGIPFIEDQKQAWRYRMYVLAESLRVY